MFCLLCYVNRVALCDPVAYASAGLRKSVLEQSLLNRSHSFCLETFSWSLWSLAVLCCAVFVVTCCAVLGKGKGKAVTSDNEPQIQSVSLCRSDHRADIFSYGVVVWELITQEQPQRGMLRDFQASCLSASECCTGMQMGGCCMFISLLGKVNLQDGPPATTPVTKVMQNRCIPSHSLLTHNAKMHHVSRSTRCMLPSVSATTA